MMYSVYRGLPYSESVTPFHGTQMHVISRQPAHKNSAAFTVPSVTQVTSALQHYVHSTYTAISNVRCNTNTVAVSMAVTEPIFTTILVRQQLYRALRKRDKRSVTDTTLQTDGQTD
jgi:hypothetical protein